MPAFVIPPAEIRFGALAAGQIVTQELYASIPASGTSLPRPLLSWSFLKIYLPVCTLTASSSTLPTTCVYNLQLIGQDGITHWGGTGEMKLLASGTYTANTTGNDIAGTDLVNPILMGAGDVFRMVVTMGYDQAVTDSYFYAGQQISQTPAGLLPFNAFGGVNYTVNRPSALQGF